MKNAVPSLLKQHSILLFAVLGLLLGIHPASSANHKIDATILASLTGVHHLGSDYLIQRFYVDKSITDSVGQGGGGGSDHCCVTLPRIWQPTLVVNVRWIVHHIIRADSNSARETAEIEGIYQAQVPVERYSEPGNFYVHFFPKGRVRIVVSPVDSEDERHPIRRGDATASQTATTGKIIDKIFTNEELAEIKYKIDRQRKQNGDWR